MVTGTLSRRSCARFAKVRRKRFDATLVLGDLVGYGAGPNQVVEAVKHLDGNVYVVRGNHDKVVCELEDGSNFNQPALAAAHWTTERLTPANLRYVREMPLGPTAIDDDLHICHGSPLDEDTYVFSIYDAYEIFTNYPAPLVFFGHTHIPSLFVLQEQGIEVAVVQGESFSLELEEGKRYLLNPGSIGQPRDRDPRTSVHHLRQRDPDSALATGRVSDRQGPGSDRPQQAAQGAGRPAGARYLGPYRSADSSPLALSERDALALQMLLHWHRQPAG